MDARNILTVAYPLFALAFTVVWLFRHKLTNWKRLQEVPGWIILGIWMPFLIAIGFVLAALTMLGNLH